MKVYFAALNAIIDSFTLARYKMLIDSVALQFPSLPCRIESKATSILVFSSLLLLLESCYFCKLELQVVKEAGTISIIQSTDIVQDLF